MTPFHVYWQGPMLQGPWRIQLFGRLCAANKDLVVDRFRTERTALLLGYLAHFGDRAHPRERLADLLWPESDADRARMSLRTALSSLRRQLEPPGTPPGTVIQSTPTSVRLNPESYRTDVGEFADALEKSGSAVDEDDRARCLLRATELYRGELLEGLYADWLIPERERLAASHVDALRKLVRHFSVKHDLNQALQYALAAIAASPQSESARLDVIRLYLALGRVDSARASLGDLETMLREDLRRAPSAATKELAHQIAARGCAAAPRSPSASPAHAAPAAPGPTAMTTAPFAASGLPLLLTRLFGRESEIQWLMDRLRPHTPGEAEPERLVTLTGPGGIGKTRLAIELSGRLARMHGVRVAFVELADISDARLVLDAVLRALGLEASPNVAALEQIAVATSGRPVLIVLDNFEQIAAEGAGYVLKMLERCADLQCLVTSRLPLGIPGERVLDVSPLPVPAAPDSPERLMEYAAVRLFVDRARSVRADFQVTAGNAAATALLCSALEGIPLALELAAARSQMLGPAQMVSMLGERFALLKRVRTNEAERHRSMWAAIDWSCHLLSPELQRFFSRLSVFRGGFTAEAASAVCEEPRAFDFVSQLRAHSLVQTADSSERPRAKLLDSIREFGWEQLPEPARDEICRRHCEYILGLVEEAEPYLTGADQATWLNRLSEEHDNVRAALGWAWSSGRGEMAARISASIWRFWWVRGHIEEGLRWLEPMVSTGQGALDSAVLARALHAAGTLSWAAGRPHDAARYHREALALRQQLGDLDGAARSLGSLGNAHRELGDLPVAQQCYSESWQLFRSLGDRRNAATSLLNLGTVAEDLHDDASARACYEESLALYREIGDRHSIALALSNLADTLGGLGHTKEALALLRECMEIRLELDSKPHICYLLAIIARVHVRAGRAELAAVLLGASSANMRSVGSPAIGSFTPAYEATLESARSELPAGSFARAFAFGESLSLDDAVRVFFDGTHPSLNSG